jgi:hypothetical protein
MAKKKPGVPKSPPKVYNRHMQSHEISWLAMYAGYRGLVSEREIQRLRFQGFVDANGVTTKGIAKLEELDELSPVIRQCLRLP